MVAAKPEVMSGKASGQVCPECNGTGTVTHWSELSNFEDRRCCRLCEEGRRVDAEIASIIKRAQAEKRPFRLYGA